VHEPPSTAWQDSDNALRYDAFTRRFPHVYGGPARHLVDLAGLSPDARVVDLACGTGVLTAELLRRVPGVRVVGVDASDPMLALARQHVGAHADAVTWRRAAGETLDAALDRPVDAVLCNAAVWYMPMPELFAAVKRVLRPGGVFVFNLPRAYVSGVFPAEAGDDRPSLALRMLATAILDHDYVPTPRPTATRPVHVDALRQMLSAARLELTRQAVCDVAGDPASHEAWMRIPVFTEPILPPFDYATRMRILEAALSGFVPQTRRAQWAAFVCRA